MGISILDLVIRRLREEKFVADIAYPGQKFPQISQPVAAVHIEKVDRAGMSVTVEVNILCPAAMGGTACELEALRATEILRWSGAVCLQNGCNQGMIQGRSNFVYRIKDTNTFVSYNLKKDYDVTPIHVDVNIVSNDILDLDKFKAWRPEFNNAEFILEDGKYVCGYAVEKMSKSMFNVVNPDDIVEVYGADTLRLYEMFLGPLEQSKPWDTNGIDGVNRFLKKMWGLFFKGDEMIIKEEKASAEALKSLHKLIKKVTFDIEHFSYNTSVSAFMICVNELNSMKCVSKEIYEELVVLLAPFAPHIAEELWHKLGKETSVCDAKWPVCNEEYLVESNVNYAISFNGKARFNMAVPNGTSKEEVEKMALAHESSAKWMEGKTPKKVIVVPNKIVNIVL